MNQFISSIALIAALWPGLANAKSSYFYECEKALSNPVAETKECGAIRIVGPDGQVTGFGTIYYGAEQKAAELKRAQHQCVSGFYAIAEDGAGC